MTKQKAIEMLNQIYEKLCAKYGVSKAEAEKMALNNADGVFTTVEFLREIVKSKKSSYIQDEDFDDDDEEENTKKKKNDDDDDE